MESASHKKVIESVFRNLLIGLKKYSLEEINDNIEAFVSDKKDDEILKKEKTLIILSVICKHFSLEMDSFLAGRGKGEIQQARKYAFCILHFDYDMPIRYISHKVFNLKWHTSVSVVIQYYKTLNEDVKVDKEFLAKLNDLRSEINSKLKNKNI